MLTTDLVYLLLTAGATPMRANVTPLPSRCLDGKSLQLSWQRAILGGQSGSSQESRHPMSFGGSGPICSELRGCWMLTAAAGEDRTGDGKAGGPLWGRRGRRGRRETLSLALPTPFGSSPQLRPCYRLSLSRSATSPTRGTLPGPREGSRDWGCRVSRYF